MFSSRTILLAAVLLIAAPTLGQTTGSPEAPEPGTFSGSWVLNRKASDDVGTLMGQARAERPQGGRGGSGGGRPGMGGGGRRGGGQMAGGDVPRGQDGSGGGGNPEAQARLRLQKEVSRLEIFTDGLELNITNGLDISRLLFCDGRETTIWTDRGEIKARARWERGSFRETWASSQGRGRTVTYRLSPDGNQLVVTEERTLPGKDESVMITLVYDRESAGQAGP